MRLEELLAVLIALDPPDKPGDVGVDKPGDVGVDKPGGAGGNTPGDTSQPTPPALCGGSISTEITGLCIDSRQCQPGDCFLAYPGLHADGRHYIEQAIQAGAAAVIYERQSTLLALSIPALAVEDLAQQVSQLAATFYQQPGSSFHIVGITGTNGKTSISHALAQAYELLGKQAAVMGTLGVGPLVELENTGMTTPDPLSVQRHLADMRDTQVDYLAMEVSSHALAMHRVAAVPIKTAVFTNLSPDHLDFHQDMQDYGRCKEKLLQFPGLEHAIINADDEWGARWIERYRDQLPIIAYSMGNPKTDLSALPALCCKQSTILTDTDVMGYELQLSGPWGKGVTQLHMLGDYNIANMLAVIATLGAQGFLWDTILSCIPKIQSVPGRMQLFRHPSGARVVVDFAHTPDALQQVLTALRPLCQGRLRCVFGCGGDRDASKRAIMGRVAASSADQIWITNDNPRTEDPEKIAQTIASGCQGHPHVQITLDRVQAITSALTAVNEHDMILIAGKGHEAVQVIGDKKIPLSDVDTVRALCA